MNNDSIIITKTDLSEIDTVPATTCDTVIASPQETPYLPHIVIIPKCVNGVRQLPDTKATLCRHQQPPTRECSYC